MPAAFGWSWSCTCHIIHSSLSLFFTCVLICAPRSEHLPVVLDTPTYVIPSQMDREVVWFLFKEQVLPNSASAQHNSRMARFVKVFCCQKISALPQRYIDIFPVRGSGLFLTSFILNHAIALHYGNADQSLELFFQLLWPHKYLQMSR